MHGVIVEAQSCVSQAESCCLKQDWDAAIQFYSRATELYRKAATMTDDAKAQNSLRVLAASQEIKAAELTQLRPVLPKPPPSARPTLREAPQAKPPPVRTATEFARAMGPDTDSLVRTPQHDSRPVLEKTVGSEMDGVSLLDELWSPILRNLEILAVPALESVRGRPQEQSLLSSYLLVHKRQSAALPSGAVARALAEAGMPMGTPPVAGSAVSGAAAAAAATASASASASAAAGSASGISGAAAAPTGGATTPAGGLAASPVETELRHEVERLRAQLALSQEQNLLLQQRLEAAARENISVRETIAEFRRRVMEQYQQGRTSMHTASIGASVLASVTRMRVERLEQELRTTRENYKQLQEKYEKRRAKYKSLMEVFKMIKKQLAPPASAHASPQPAAGATGAGGGGGAAAAAATSPPAPPLTPRT